MSHKTFLTLHGAVYAFFALALFLLPAQIWPLYGVQVNDAYAHFLSQHNSIFLGGIAAISLLLRDLDHLPALRKLLQGLLITNLLGVLITLYAAVTGIFTGFGWSDPAFFALLALLCQWQLGRAR